MKKSKLVSYLYFYKSSNFLKPALIILILLAWALNNNYSKFITPTDVPFYSLKFANSQYMLGDASPEKVSDEVVYIYTGIEYFKGVDPTSNNFEHPPFGKYMIGFSYRLFNNVLSLNIFWYLLVLSLFHILTGIVIKQQKYRFLALFLFGSLKIMRFYFGLALLDIMQLSASFLFFVSLLKINNKWYKHIILGLSLGMLMSIKYYFPMIFLFIGMTCIYFIWQIFERKSQKKKIKLSYLFKQIGFYLFSFGLMSSFYLANYFVYFQTHSLLEFLQFEKFRFVWWVGDRGSIPKFLNLSTILTGKFKYWFQDGYEYASSYSLWWPFFFLNFLISSLLIYWNLIKNGASKIILKDFPIIFICGYALTLLILYSLGSAAAERYLIQQIPFWIIISFYTFEKIRLELKIRSILNKLLSKASN